MKTTALICCLMLLAGCAVAPEEKVRTQSLDVDKVIAVERAARASGVTVIWVNPPTQATR